MDLWIEYNYEEKIMAYIKGILGRHHFANYALLKSFP
jgi:hypothetical protein